MIVRFEDSSAALNERENVDFIRFLRRFMVKIRLEGTEEEVRRCMNQLHDDGGFDLLSVSDPYPNRGRSKFVRVYIDADIIEDIPNKAPSESR